jgi:hypothetical protein
MFLVVAALSLTPITYGFAPGSANTYYARVVLKGYLPILGGKEGQGQVDMAIGVTGLNRSLDGKLKTSSDLTDFKLWMNGAQLPLSVETAKGFFPKNTVVFTPQGRVVENDASDSQLPVRLPGLDPKRFPDITYIPIEFPAEGIEEGKSWSFRKLFDTLDINYTVTPQKVSDRSVEMKIDLKARDEFLEDASHTRTETESESAFKVVSDLTGGGAATFNRRTNLVDTVTIKMTIDSKVTETKTNRESPRRLEITLDVSLGKALPSSAALAKVGTGPLDLLRDKIQQSRPVQRALVASQLVHPSSRNWRSAIPLVRSAMDSVHIPSKGAVQGQLQNLAVLTRKTTARIPELLNVHGVQPARNFLSCIPGVVGLYWRPYNERAYRFADQVVQHISPEDASAYQAPGIRRSKNHNKPDLPASKVKARG